MLDIPPPGSLDGEDDEEKEQQVVETIEEHLGSKKRLQVAGRRSHVSAPRTVKRTGQAVSGMDP